MTGEGAAGELMPRRRDVTRQDVAARAGVSTAVVSYVINSGPRPVAPATREKVLRAIEELGYRPNRSAQSLRLGRTQTLALLVPDISNPFFAELAGQVQLAAREAGYALHFADVGNDPRDADDQIATFVHRQVDGILVIGLDTSTDFSPALERGVPVVAMDNFRNTPSIPTVALNDRAAAHDGVIHLLSHGHSRIAMIAGPEGTAASEARIAGWADALGRPLEELRGSLVHAEYSPAGGMSAIRELLDRPTGASAVFVASDIQAVGVIRVLHAARVSIPGDLAVLGFDGTTEGAYTWPSLTTVRQPAAVMAQEACAIVTGARPSGHLVVEHEIIRRQSCGCVPV